MRLRRTLRARASPPRLRAQARAGARSPPTPEMVRRLRRAGPAEEMAAATVALHIRVLSGELRLDGVEVAGMRLAVHASVPPPVRGPDAVRQGEADAVHGEGDAAGAVERGGPGA